MSPSVTPNDEIAKIAELDGPAVRDLLSTELRGVVVDFWSPWCAPCRVIRPHLHKLAQERHTQWRFVAVNTEKHPAAAEDFQVASLPTVAFFHHGQELHRFAGTVLLSSIVGKLDELSPE